MKFVQVKCHLKLLFCTFLVCFSQVLIGSSFIFTSSLLVELREPLSEIKLTVEEESWVVSVPVLLCPVGLLIIGVLIDNIGKVITLQINLVPMTLSWLLLLFADSYRAIMIARILLGFCFGVYSCMVLFIIEICPASLRSIYVSAATLCAGLGMLMETVMSAYVNWRTVSGIMCAMSAANLLALFAVPEPSMWLRTKGRAEEADRVDSWLDLKHVDSTVSGETAVAEHNGRSANAEQSQYWSLYLRSIVWKPTLIMLTFFLLQHCSGIYVMLLYSIDVLRLFKVPLDDYTLSLFMSVARVLGAVGFAMLHNIDRRPLMIVSSSVMAASLLVIIVCMHAFKDVQDQPFTVTVTQVVAFAAFMFFALLGVMPIPWILCGEVFPMAVKGVMNGFCQAFGYIIWFLICKIYPLIILKYGADIVWSVLAGFCVLNILFAIFIMPETRGKTVDEILSYFETNKKIKNPNMS